MIKKIRNKICVIMAPMFFHAFRIFKVKNNKIVIVNNFGKGYGDNQKYICDELIKRNSDIDIVWLVNDINDSTIPKEIRKVKYNSLKSIYELVTAKIWIDNFRKQFYCRKRSNQYYIQLWHGCGALKKIEFDVKEKLSKYYVKSMINDNKMVDLMISDSTFFTEKCRTAFKYNGNILEIGVPREDILINNTQMLNNKARETLDIKDKKILLYAPTFRNSFEKSTYDVDFSRIINKLNKGNTKWIVLIRLHPHISKMANIFNYNKDIINVSDYPDMQELIAAADLVITDFSSIMFEAMRIDKKVILYANDIEKYVDERGFYFKLNELPFPLAKNNNELLNYISDNHNFINDYEQFKKKMGYYENHNSIVEMGDYINNIIKNGDRNE